MFGNTDLACYSKKKMPDLICFFVVNFSGVFLKVSLSLSLSLSLTLSLSHTTHRHTRSGEGILQICWAFLLLFSLSLLFSLTLPDHSIIMTISRSHENAVMLLQLLFLHFFLPLSPSLYLSITPKHSLDWDDCSFSLHFWYNLMIL